MLIRELIYFVMVGIVESFSFRFIVMVDEILG